MKLLLLSGGRHPYAETTPILVEFLSQAGHEVATTEEASILARWPELDAFDALVFNTRRENLPDFGDSALHRAEREGLDRFIAEGKGFVCLHISTCRPAEWHGFHEITGGGWITGTSFHPPYGRFAARVVDPGHEVVRGVGAFEIDDELYMGLAGDAAFPMGTIRLQPGEKVLLYSDGVETAFYSEADGGFDTTAYLSVFESVAHLPVDKMVAEIERTMNTQQGSIAPQDDVTILAIEITEH